MNVRVGDVQQTNRIIEEESIITKRNSEEDL
jgi:hypothetical protein